MTRGVEYMLLKMAFHKHFEEHGKPPKGRVLFLYLRTICYSFVS